MALATQCPHCQTVFRVAQDQLKLRAGLVRCGSCKEIFNGVEHLLPSDDLATAPHKFDVPVAHHPIPAQTHADISPVAPITAPYVQPKAVTSSSDLDFAYPEPIPESEPLTAAEAIAGKPTDVEFVESPRPIQNPLFIDEPIPANFSAHQDHGKPEQMQENLAPIAAIEEHFITELDDTAIEEAPIAPHEPFFSDHPAIPVKPSAEQESGYAKAKRIEPQIAEQAQQTDDEDEPSFVKKGRRQQKFGKTVRIAMGVGAVLLLLTGLGQAAYAFRSQIVARAPETKPALFAVCTLFRCNIGLPAQIETLSIESNDLETLGTNKNASELSILLRNNSSTVESWPHLELTLNDANGNMLSRRVFAPSEYLAAGQELKKGLASNAEQPIKLYLEISNIKPSGYHVDLFYP